MAPGAQPGEAPDIRRRPLPYVDSLQRRELATVDLLVVHCTELPDLEAARIYGERRLYEASGTGNSGHYYIDRDGRIEEWAPPHRVAHHVRGYNDRSLGVELVNRGRYPDWFDSRGQEMSEPYPAEQIEGLVVLIAWLQSQLPSLRWIAGHEDLDTGTVPASDDSCRSVLRKRDPGPLFPWAEVLERCGLPRLLPPGGR